MGEKKKTNWFKYIMIALFLAYISLYGISKSGYYEGSIRKRVEFTEEQIKAFEKDIEDGKNVDIQNYLQGQNKNYTNNVSKLGYTISTNVDKFMNRGIKDIVKILTKILS